MEEKKTDNMGINKGNMRFDTLFHEYYYKRKIKNGTGMEGVDNAIQKMSATNFWLLSFLFSFLILFLFIYVVQAVTNDFNGWYPAVILSIMTMLLISLGYVNGRAKKELEYFETKGREYSSGRINLVKSLLDEYGINASDKERLKLLMEEAKKNKRKYDYFTQFKKPKKVAYTLLLPFAAYLGKFYAEHKAEVDGFNKFLEEIKEPLIVFVLLFFALMVFSFAIMPSLDRVIKARYYCHEEFIEDLRQIILFDGCEFKNKQDDKADKTDKPEKES